jgi:polynucleotide 5'-hydroxyl-kinase GRC3/NOL9
MTAAAIVQICLDSIKQSKASLIYLLGADDAGKTTLAKELANQLILENEKVAIIDADPGQSSRLPLTVSLNYANRQFDDFSELVLADWDFVPDYDLMKCFDKYIGPTRKWAERARGETDYCLIDSSGDLRRALKRVEIEILKPDLLVALERKSELEPILEHLESQILRLLVPEEAKRKSPRLRRELRNQRLRLYFRSSSTQTIKCEAPGDFNERIVGLYGRGEFLGLGIAQARNGDELTVMTPVAAQADTVELSSVKYEW